MTAAPSTPGRGEQLAVLLSAAELAAARRNTLNAHYTDAAFVTGDVGGGAGARL